MIKDLWHVLTGRLSFSLAAEHKRQAMLLHDENIFLAKQLREIDDQLWSISQTLDKDKQKKVLSNMILQMEARKIKESKRITNILIPELERTYGR